MRQQQGSIIAMSLLIVMAGLLGLALPAHADVIVKTVIGEVQVSVDGEQWTALAQGSSIQPGDIVQTGLDGEVIVQAEDGSVFYLREFSQLKFIELTLTNDVRMYQAELLQGMVNVDVPFLPVEDDNNLVQIITDIAMADATITGERPTSFQMIYDPSILIVEVYNFGGIVTMEQIAEGTSSVAGLFGGSDGGGKEGLTFPVNRNGAVVMIEVQPETATIIVKSTLGVDEITAMLGDYMGMEATNIDAENQAPLTMFMPNGEDVLTLAEEGDKIFVATSPSSVVLASAPNYLHAQFKFFRELGTFWMWDLCDCGRATWGTEAPQSQIQNVPNIARNPETVVVPAPPGSPPREAAGSPVLP